MAEEEELVSLVSQESPILGNEPEIGMFAVNTNMLNTFHSSYTFLILLSEPSINKIYCIEKLLDTRDLYKNPHQIHEYHILFTIFQDFFIIQVYKNISSITIRLHSNIGKIICKNVNNIFHIQNFGNFKTDFFLNLYLRIFLVKQVSSKNCSFYGLPL